MPQLPFPITPEAYTLCRRSFYARLTVVDLNNKHYLLVCSLVAQKWLPSYNKVRFGECVNIM